MKPALYPAASLAALCLLLVPVQAQTIDTVVFLPDSFVGPTYPRTVAAHPGLNKAYIAGWGGLGAVLALDGNSRQKTARIPMLEDVEVLIPNLTADVIYALGRHWLAVIEPLSDTLVAELNVGTGPGIGAWSRAANALYLANALYGQLLKVDGNSHLPVVTIQVPLTPVALEASDSVSKLYVAGHENLVAAIDVNSDSVLATIPVGDSPSDLLYQPGRNLLYCANRLANSITVIDCATDTAVAQIQVGSSPVALVFDRLRAKLYCANRNSGSVTVVDGDNHRVLKTVAVPSPQTLALDEAADRLYVGSAGELLTAIDCNADTTVFRIQVGADCKQLTLLAQHILLAPSAEAGTVALLQSDSLLGRIQVSTSYPRAALAVRDKLYVCQERMNRVDVVSTATCGLLAQLPVGRRPYAIALSRASDKVYCACKDSNQVWVIDPRSDSVVGRVGVGISPHSLAWDSVGNKLYCGNYGSQQLTVIDCRADTVLKNVNVGRATRKVVCNPVSRKVYLACHDSYTFEVVDCSTDAVVATFGTGGNPWTLALDRTDNLVYCASSWGGPVICGSGDTLVGEIGEVFYVKGSAWNPQSNLVYLAMNFSDQVLVVDGPTHTTIAQVGVPEYPADMVSMEDSRRVYCCHNYSNRLTSQVSVLQDDSLVASLTVRPSPVAPVADDIHGRVYVLSGDASCITVIRDRPVGLRAEARSAVAGLTALPSPFRARTTILLPGHSAARPPGHSLVHIYDSSGRLVSSLAPGRESRTPSSVSWDGTDASGEPAPPGCYFAMSGPYRLRLLKVGIPHKVH